MISRRALLAGGALALAGSASPARLLAGRRQIVPAAGATGGRLRYGGVGGATRQKAADQARLSSAELRNAALVFHVGIYAERFLRPLSPRGYSGRDRPGTMEADGRRRGRGAAARTDIERSARELRRGGNLLPSASAQATGADFPSRMCPACNGVSARWGMHSGRARRPKYVLSRANVRPETVEVALNGADGPVLDGTPDFIKSIPLDKALDENTLIAYEMNGAPLPHYNGFPIRLSCRAGRRPTG